MEGNRDRFAAELQKNFTKELPKANFSKTTVRFLLHKFFTPKFCNGAGARMRISWQAEKSSTGTATDRRDSLTKLRR